MDERVAVVYNNINNYFQDQKQEDDTLLILLPFLQSQVSSATDEATREQAEEALDKAYERVGRDVEGTHKQALEELSTGDVEQLIVDTYNNINRDYYNQTGRAIRTDTNQQDVVLDIIAANLLSLTPVDIANPTVDSARVETPEQITGEAFETFYEPLVRTFNGQPFGPDVVLQNAIQGNIERSQNTVIKFPSAFASDVQLGILAQQMADAGIIDYAQAESDLVLGNLEKNLPTILQQLDEVSSENEKNFTNIADKLINQATTEPVTEAQIREYAKYAWLNDIATPNLPAGIQQSKEQEILNTLVGEGYIENAGSQFKKKIEALYRIDENDPHKTQKQAERKNKIAQAEQQIALIQAQGGTVADQAESIQQALNKIEFGDPEQNIPSIIESYDFVEKEGQLQDAIDQRNEINKDPQSFQQQYMQAGPMEKAELDSMLEEQLMLGYGVTPSGRIEEIPQFDTSTISDPSARAAMEQFMAYTQKLTPEEQFDMQLRGMPPSLPQDIMEGFEAIRPSKEGYTPIIDEQGNWTGDVLPLYPYGTSEEEKQSMIDDYRRQTTKRLPKTKMTPGVDYSLSIDEMEDDKGFNASYTLTPKGGLDQKDLESNISEDFDLTPPAKPKTKPKVKTQEFDARI